MLLDELITVIETLKQRITDHGAILQDNETRTRMALIDPLLHVLGWDTTDPFLVIPEYDAGGGQVDYALLGKKGGPTAVIEAKRLGEPLQKYRHKMVRYAKDAASTAPALPTATNGNSTTLLPAAPCKKNEYWTCRSRPLLPIRPPSISCSSGGPISLQHNLHRREKR